MLEQYEEFRRNINIKIDVDKDYTKAEKDLCKYLNMLKTYDKTYVQSDLWFVYYNLGLVNKKQNRVKEAIKYTKLSVKYYEEDTQYIKTAWLLGVCYELILPQDAISKKQMTKKVLRIYGRCATYYKINNMNDRRMMLMFNMAKIKKSTRHMFKMIQILLNELEKEETPITYNQHQINIGLLEMGCTELIDLYTENNDNTSIFRLINLINIKSVKENVKEHVKRNKVIFVA